MLSLWAPQNTGLLPPRGSQPRELVSAADEAFFQKHFSPADLKIIANEIIRLKDHPNKYEIACKKFPKSHVTYLCIEVRGKQTYVGSRGKKIYRRLVRAVSLEKERRKKSARGKIMQDITNKLIRTSEVKERLRLQVIDKENVIKSLNVSHTAMARKLSKSRRKAESTQRKLDEETQVIDIYNCTSACTHTCI